MTLVPADLPSAGLVVSVLRLDLLAKLALAVLLGGTVGLERELSGKPAGLRTNILICVGSAMLMDLSVRIGITETGARVGDPARLAAQVVSGIGFLGAGTILQARGTVVGLTTAATIWVVAAIGLTIGSGSYLEALGATLLVASVLWGLGRVEKRLLQTRRVIGGTLRVLPRTPFDELEQIFNSAGIQVVQKTVYEHTDDRTYELKLMGPARQYDIIAAALMRRSDVLSAQFD
ncbi:MAG TPA: MgtC/SapB family protein [Gemmatimonadaceae bacterium]